MNINFFSCHLEYPSKVESFGIAVEKPSTSSVDVQPTLSHMSAASVLIWLFMNHSSDTHVENRSDACTHNGHICMSETSSLGFRVANRLLSSVLPAGCHAPSITAKYQRLLSEGLEDPGCPNQSPDLNPCSGIKLKRFRVMKASKPFSCCVTGLLMLIWVTPQVMWSEPECCPPWKIGVCRRMVATTAATVRVDVEPGTVCIWLREQMGDFNMQMWFRHGQMLSERRAKAHNYEHKRHCVELVWSYVCVLVCTQLCSTGALRPRLIASVERADTFMNWAHPTHLSHHSITCLSAALTSLPANTLHKSSADIQPCQPQHRVSIRTL